jgi:hypothetical protein
VSLGINNVCGKHRVRAFLCGDPPEKFHHGIWFDAALLKFVPHRRMRNRVRVKKGDDFASSSLCVKDCPNVFGYKRDSVWEPDNFFTRDAATWGCGQKCTDETKKPKVLFTFFTGLRLMHYLGVRRVYLLGADFTMSADYGYAFEQARWPGAIRDCNTHYRVANPMCDELVPVFQKHGYEVYNCNPNSGLRSFPFVPFEDAVEDCRGLVPKEPFDLSGWYEKQERVPKGETD